MTIQIYHLNVKSVADLAIVNMENGRPTVRNVMDQIFVSMVLKSILVDPAVVMDIANTI